MTVVPLENFQVFRDSAREQFTDPDAHYDGCPCAEIRELGNKNIHELLRTGAIPTEDMRGWMNALSYMGFIFDQMANIHRVFEASAIQTSAMAVLLEDLQKTEFDK